MKAGTGRTLSDAQRLDWLRLIRSENIGPRTFRGLLNQFGGATEALEALPDLARRGGASRGTRMCTMAEAEREIAGLHKLGARLVALGEPDYPVLLAHADGAPPLITVTGSGAVLALPAIAIVGARNASAAGRTFAARLAGDLAAAGFAIVSGLARGIDAAAHEASLSSGTIAALAGGPDRIYPPEHTGLLARLLERGAAVTEMPLGWEPRARDFPRRNRLIAGIAHATVIVEAAMRSGSLITARLANEMGREVMAAPGSPLDPRCEGSNALLRDGATLITRAEHVIEALAPGFRGGLEMAPPPDFERDADAVVEDLESADIRGRIEGLLGPSPCVVDDLIRLSSASARQVQLVLLELEVAGRLERHPGGRISLSVYE